MADGGDRRGAGMWRALVLACGVVAPLVAGRAMAAARDFALPVFQQDFGGVGLLQTPTARMAPTGEFSFHLDRVDPYTHYTFTLQPFSWMEASLRYTQISNRPFRASNGRLDYLDKGLSAKFSLLGESRYIPAVAVGFRDIGGTGLFGGEYLVADKRWYDFDFSFGIGWGYLGARGDIGNPLQVFSDHFEQRGVQTARNGGDFNFKQLFAGRTSVFGGLQYQTPFEPLTLQLEYDGNDYDNEPLGNRFDQDLPVNVGARLRINDHLTLSAALERGNTAMLGGTLSVNLATISQPKNDPPPVVPKPRGHAATDDWRGVASQLAHNAGISVTSIKREGDALVVAGQSARYRWLPKAELRANRILHNAAGSGITHFKYRWKRRGLYLREDDLPRKPLPAQPLLTDPAASFSDLDYRHGVVATGAAAKQAQQPRDQALYTSFNDRFAWNLSPAVNYNYGGPDGFLYQVYARLDSQFKTDEHGWFSNTLAYGLFDNLENFDFVGPSELPRVRTYIVNYLDQTDLGIYNLQYTRTARLSQNWFGLAYAGLLERMFGGVGGEMMYRPFNSRVALGFDVNWVKQRAFDTQFDFRDYSTTTGHATAYIHTGFKHILAKLSVGRYLAGDNGGTIDLSRTFDSGVRVGAFATFTDAGNKFGEGSFDKGIYLSFPLDVFFTQSTHRYVGIHWRPLTRDGGQYLDRRYNLYGLTDERNLGRYWDNFARSTKR